jgi:phosphatidylglycerol:prolipoprotein diacylglycerol transferase
MHPVFVLGGLEIYAYALFTWLGAASACILALPGLKRAGMTAMQRCVVLMLMCICFLVGARLWNVAVNPVNYLGAFKWYTLKLAGFSLYGGLTGAVAALILFVKVCRIRILPILDAMVVPGSAAFCIARIGCFLNGCCGGIATNGPFGVVFPQNEPSGPALPGLLSFVNSRPVHPTQLYELAGAAAGLLAVVLICRKYDLPSGSRFLFYAAVFSGVRLLVLPFRSLPYTETVRNVLYPGLYLAIIFACAAGVRVLAKRRH